MQIGWPEEQVEVLLQMHQEGRTAGQIAAVIDRSRNAVLGKIFRMGLSKPFVPWPEGVPRPKRQRKPYLRRWPRRRLVLPSVFLKPSVPQLEADLCNIMDLTDKRCRWPMWGDESSGFYCGGLPNDGSVYCAFHRHVSRNGVKEGAESSPRMARPHRRPAAAAAG